MAFPSQGAAGGPSEGPPHPSGELWDLCLQLEFFTNKECRLLAAIVQILKEQASSSGNLVRLTSALQEFLGDYEGSLGNVVTKLHQFSADKLGSLLVMIQARIDHADRSSRRASSSYAGPSRAGHVQSSPSASVIEVPITAHPNPTTSPPVIKPLHPPTSQAARNLSPSACNRQSKRAAPATSSRRTTSLASVVSASRHAPFVFWWDAVSKVTNSRRPNVRTVQAEPSFSRIGVRFTGMFKARPAHLREVMSSYRGASAPVRRNAKWETRTVFTVMVFSSGGASGVGSCASVDYRWDHIFFHCKHRDKFRDIENDPVLSSDETMLKIVSAGARFCILLKSAVDSHLRNILSPPE